ncbi:MAG: MBL fold metallo-hydrolase [Burkholderiaceae bacterium]|nr:MBL fold metallo-hydrolase [Burkholderiaceae bacterium]
MSDAPAPPAAAALPESLRFIERDWLSSNQVVGFAGNAAIVVDTGYAKHAALTVELVRRVLDARERETGGSIRLVGIVNTHLHSDHCGGNRALAHAFGCPITVPAASAADVAAWDEVALTHATTGQRCERFRHAATLAPGETFRLGGLDWRVLAAPGHDPKSLIFHCEREGLLVSADALWEQGFGVIFPELDGHSGFDEQRSVLELIATLPVRLVLPGHGRAFSDVRGALDRAFTRLEALRADPRRHARHALKVLVKFLLLDLERVEATRLVDFLRRATVMQRTAELIGMEFGAALAWAADELVAQGQLRRDGAWLLNA